MRPIVFTIALAAAADAADDDELRAVAEMVKASQVAGFEEHGFDAYIAPWAKGSKMVLGRGPAAGEHDNVIPYEKLRAVRKLRMSAPRPKMILTYWDESHSREGGAVKLSWTARTSEPGSYELTRETYRLEKIGDDWKIVENRAWVTETRWGGVTTRYNEATWERLDAAVEAARARGDPLLTAGALMGAFRFGEAHAAAKEATATDAGGAEAWRLRGFAAIQSGDADDALASFEKARALDSEIDVPGYAR